MNLKLKKADRKYLRDKPGKKGNPRRPKKGAAKEKKYEEGYDYEKY